MVQYLGENKAFPGIQLGKLCYNQYYGNINTGKCKKLKKTFSGIFGICQTFGQGRTGKKIFKLNNYKQTVDEKSNGKENIYYQKIAVYPWKFFFSRLAAI